MNGFIMYIIKCVSACRNLYSPVNRLPRIYTCFYSYRNCSDDRTFVRSYARSIRSDPTIAAFLASFLFFYFTIEFNKYIYTKKAFAILRQQRRVQELGRVSICNYIYKLPCSDLREPKLSPNPDSQQVIKVYTKVYAKSFRSTVFPRK